MNVPGPRSDARVEQIMFDLTCPQCDYNLRGLYGPIIHCPECGYLCNLAKLVSLRWTRPWHQAPRLNVLASATFWIVVAPLLLSIAAFFLIDDGYLSTEEGTLAASLVVLGGWIVCLWLAYKVFNAWRGVWMSLMLHLILAVYLGAVAMPVVFLITVADRRSAMAQMTSGTLLAIAFAAAWGARRGERWIARQCIREYLRRKSEATPPPALPPQKTQAQQ